MNLRVVQLVAENFKRLVAVEISPEGNIVEIAGNNGEGKSSVLDAIWVALKGRAANPPEPIRQGEEVAYIELDLGKYRIVRRFTRQEGGDYTDFLRVEDPEGLQYPKPQQTLDRLLGAIGFDPFAFVQLKPEKQAAALLGLVTLTDDEGKPVDLAELRSLDKRLYDTRRDVNRDLKNAEARLTALPAGEKKHVGDIEALRTQLTSAAEHNGAIERRKGQREAFLERLASDRNALEKDRESIAAMIAAADAAEADIAARQKQVDDAEDLPAPIDTAAVSAALAEAEKNREANRVLEQREAVVAEVAERRTSSCARLRWPARKCRSRG
jgi:DNA repair exonuclease SbcCD ATPase subunit